MEDTAFSEYVYITLSQSHISYQAADSVTISNSSSANKMYGRRMPTALKRISHESGDMVVITKQILSLHKCRIIRAEIRLHC